MEQTSKVRLYSIPGLSEEKNFVIQNIYDFLHHHETGMIEIEKVQYQRLENFKTLKISKPQKWASQDPALTSPYPNYCAIVETGNGWNYAAYYYVVAVDQRAPNTIKLSLQLDALNTFYDNWRGLFTQNTRIIREHRSRFKAVQGAETGHLLLFPVFSRTAENENPKLVNDGTLTAINDRKGGSSGLRFYLIYRTSEEGTPCIDLAASEQIKISSSGGGASYEIPIAYLVTGRYYYVIGDNLEIEIEGERQHINPDNTPDPATDDVYTAAGSGIFVFWKVPMETKIAVQFVSTGDNITALSGEWWNPSQASYISRDHWTFDRGINVTEGKTLYYSNTLTFDTEEIKTFSSIAINAGTSAVYLSPISTLDFSDAKNVKVIECPYCPINYEYDSINDLYTFEAGKFLSKSPEGFLRSYDVAQIEFLNENIAEIYPALTQDCTAATLTAARGTLKDPKLWTSEFQYYAFVYDSFSYMFKLEDYKPRDAATYRAYTKITINYKQSSAISSNLLFEVDLNSDGMELERRSENFANILPATRNNELALYSSAYLDYIRNGYNYDKKKIERTAATNATTTALQVLGSLLSFALSGVTGGVSAAAGVTLATSAAGSIFGSAASLKSANEDLEQKINLLRSQAFSVSGIDDLDLFRRYGKNKLMYSIYHMQPEDLARIDAKFYFTGYASERCGIPERTREYFDFLQCEPDFYDSDITAVSELPEYLDLVREKLRAGVTFFWSSGFYKNNYSLAQTKENIELDIALMLE